MAYVKQTWSDGVSGGTPITASRLNHIENGIEAVSESVDKTIPVEMTRDCNVFTAGEYNLVYVGTNGANRPPASSTATKKNGWLETMAYTDQYAHQTYITYDGTKYERHMNAGTWSEWVTI